MLITALFLASVSSSMPQDETAPLPAVPVVSHAQLTQRLKALPAAALLPVGRSRAGREIHAVRIPAAPTPGKPSVLIVANVDGSQTWTSALALHHAERWSAQAHQGRLEGLLEWADVIVLPCANPDAHERRFADVLHEREATGDGVDDDRDGVQDEDAPSDVDGDGRITWMRVEDDAGEWIEDPADPRAMIRADPKRGERGRWKVWPEGRDLDGDERVAEDALEDACVNRNFPEEFREHAPESGRFATSEPEARALIEFVLLHPEIALVVTYGSYDNLVEKPKTTPEGARNKLMPAPGVIEADAELLVELGARYGEITGNKSKGRGGDAGTFAAWAYGHHGLWSLAIQPWDIPLDAKPKTSDGQEAKSDDAAQGETASEAKPKAPARKDKREASDDAKRLIWLDAHADESARFVAWRTFEHPELGSVEIGGFAPFARTEPPAPESGAIADKEFRFVQSLGAELALVRIAEFEAKTLGGGLYDVRAAIHNPSRLPMQSASARRTRTVRPLRTVLKLEGGAQLLGGDDAIELERRLGGAGARIEYRWLVRAARVEDIALSIDTDHAGRDERRAELSK